MTNTTPTIKIVIGSWGSYNECNERALGSSWLTLNEYDSWDDVIEELKRQGFELDGIDEELFIQDIEGFEAELNWDYVNPQTLFNLFKTADILNDNTLYELALAFIEAQGFNEWERRVLREEERWAEDLYLYPCNDWEELGQHFFYEVECIDNILMKQGLDWIENYFDFEAYGRQFSFDSFYVTNYGILEIR